MAAQPSSLTGYAIIFIPSTTLFDARDLVCVLALVL